LSNTLVADGETSAEELVDMGSIVRSWPAGARPPLGGGSAQQSRQICLAEVVDVEAECHGSSLPLCSSQQ